MTSNFRARVHPYLHAFEVNAGLVAGGIVGAFFGLFGAVVGALLGFMIDRVLSAFSRTEKPDEPSCEPATSGNDPREILGLGPDAGPSEIRHAWRHISKECHPDIGDPTEEGARRFREAREAYEALLEPKSLNRSPRE